MYKRLDHIDALRGLAALAIILFHLVRIPDPDLPLPNYLSFISTVFGLGVPMFFIISGFSIFFSLSSRELDRKWIPKFFIRRFFRIAPLFYFMLCFYIFRGALYGNITSFHDILLNISFSYTFFPGKHGSIVWAGWPISIEIFFYLTVPFLFRFVDSLKKSILLLLVAFCFSALFKFYLSTFAGIPKTYYNMNIATQFPFLVLGIVSFFIYEKNKINQNKNNILKLLFISLAIILFFTEIGVVLLPAPLQFYRKYIWGLFFSLVLILSGNHEIKYFVNKVTQFLGKLSYSLYLGHPFIIYSLGPIYQKIYLSVDSILLAFLLCTLLTIPMVVLLACLLYNLIENPTRKFSYKFINNMT